MNRVSGVPSLDPTTPLEEWGDWPYMVVIGGIMKGCSVLEEIVDVSWLQEQRIVVRVCGANEGTC